MWGWFALGFAACIATEIVAGWLIMKFDEKDKKKTEAKMNLQPPNAYERREPERAIDAQILKVQTTEPTFGTSLDQVRRDYRLPDEKTNGMLGLAHIYVKRLNAMGQLRAESELAEEEERLRHKMRLLQIEHEIEERAKAYDMATDLAASEARKMVQVAREMAELMKDLGIDNEAIEAEVLRFIRMTVELIGTAIVVGGAHA